MKKFAFVAGIAGFAMLFLPMSVLAAHHEEERAPLSDVWLIVPKQGMEAQFKEAVQADIAFRVKGEDSRAWDGYTTVIGHNISAYQFRYCCFNWADQDAYIAEEEEKGFNANWGENVHQYVDHYHHYLETMDWEYSHWPEDETDGPYYAVTSWTWKENAGPGPDEARKKLSQIALKEGWADAGRKWLWHTRIGGKSKLMIVSPYANFAAMEPPEQSFFEFVSEKMDSEEEVAALFNQFGSGFSSSDYTVWMYDENLSAPSEDD